MVMMSAAFNEMNDAMRQNFVQVNHFAQGLINGNLSPSDQPQMRSLGTILQILNDQHKKNIDPKAVTASSNSRFSKNLGVKTSSPNIRNIENTNSVSKEAELAAEQLLNPKSHLEADDDSDEVENYINKMSQ